MKKILIRLLTAVLAVTLVGCGNVKGTPGSKTTPTPAANALFSETDMTIGTDEWKLPGTLVTPKGDGPFPVVVLIHGSGPSNRNEKIGPSVPFKDIAEGLAKQGIASLRFDKRTYVYGKKMANLDMTVNEESVDDAVRAYDLLKTTSKIDSKRIYIIGHSLGGTLIPRIAERTPDAAGYIILAGAVRPLEDLILEQTDYILSMNKTLSDEQKKAQHDMVKAYVDRIKALKPGDKVSAQELMGAPSSYWLDLKSYDPVKTAQKLDKPLLVLQGGRDYQVTQADFELWKAGLSSKSSVTFKFYDNLNHLFMTGEGKSTPDEYAVKGTFSQDAINDMAAFINKK